MYDVELRKMMMNERYAALHRLAVTSKKVTFDRPRRPAEDTEIELRLCRASDDPALDRLAALSETEVPSGRLVVALTGGRLVAALPLAGGAPLTDPFSRTAHLLPLLRMRALQLRQPARPRGALRLLRRHA